MSDHNQESQIQELTPPEPIKSVSSEEAAKMVPISDEDKKTLNERVKEFVELVVSNNVQSEEFNEQLNSVHALGNKEIRDSANMSNRFLEQPTRTLGADGVFSENAPVAKNLLELRKTVESLDPSKKGDLLSPKKILGVIPFGNKLTEYFRLYQSSQTHINKILESLYNGQDELQKDNSAVEIEKANLWTVMGRMEQYIYLGKQIDSELEAKLSSIESQDQNKARVIRDEMLFYVRQKVQDLLTQLAVSIQGYLALDIIRKNNLELIKGVERATTTTVSALRTAVMVAQALNNQKLVLDQVSALNKTTSDIIQGTAAQLREQGAEIQKQASGTTIDIEALNNAFENIYASIDAVSEYKKEALDSMKETVNVLSDSIDRSKPFIEKIQNDADNTNQGGSPLLALE